MGDLAYLEEFLAEPEIIAETPKPNPLDAISVPGSDVSENVNIIPGDKAQDAFDAKKKAQSLFDGAKDVKAKTDKVLGAAVPSLDDFPTPSGGVGLLLFIALLVVFAITKAPGQDVTRLQLVWGSILGNYSYSDTASSGPSKQSAITSGNTTIIPMIQGGV